MRVLAIDPGYGRCGIAVLEKSAAQSLLVYSECVETDAKMDFPDRLHAIVAQCSEVIRAHQPDHIALEKLYFSTNKKTAMRVAEVRGAILGLAGSLTLAVFEYAPNEVKSATTGYGSADKKAIAQMVRALVKIVKPIRLDDEYDAIAIGITHLATYRPSHHALKPVQ